MTPELPPILLSPGLVLVAVGTTDHGTPFMKFQTSPFHMKRAEGRRLSEVVVYVTVSAPAKLLYAYSYSDPTSHTVVSYHGVNGDPELDTLGDIDGV